MTSFIGQGLNWVRGLSDFQHHGMVLGGTAVGVGLLRYATPTGLGATALTMVGAQFGTQAWVAFVGGPTMFLNMKRLKFGDIQARLFPKYGMIGTSTSLLALGCYHFAHPTPDKLTKLLGGTAVAHMIQSFVLFPATAYYQYEMRKYPNVMTQEYQDAERMFKIMHFWSVITSVGTMSANVWFFYSIAKRAVKVW